MQYSTQLKWGETIVSPEGGINGFQALPDALVRNQAFLCLTATEMVVLINITMHWWKCDSWPYPAPQKIGERMGLTSRSVERSIVSMEKKGILSRIRDGDKTRFDLSPLKDALETRIDNIDSHDQWRRSSSG